MLCASQPVSCLVQGSTRDSDEPAIVTVVPSTDSFRDIGSDTVGSADDLLANGISGKLIPVRNGAPDYIGKLLRKSIDP